MRRISSLEQLGPVYLEAGMKFRGNGAIYDPVFFMVTSLSSKPS
jgi:hypothetical protein